jgi:hypothetical protein
MKEIQSPDRSVPKANIQTIFLAGSIEMNSADNWQVNVCELLKHLDVVLYNPRRDDWDNSWKQDVFDANFSEQVHWELDKLNESDWIFMYFDPNTKSPISLLELGLYASSGKLIVCCPDGFWRQGNVDIVCIRHDIPLFQDLETAVRYLEYSIKAEKINEKSCILSFTSHEF